MSKYFNFTQLLKFNRIYTQKCVDVKWGQGGGGVEPPTTGNYKTDPVQMNHGFVGQ